MANNKIQIKRTTVSGRTANTTNAANAAFIDKGELAVNLADRKIFSSDAANVLFEVGSNLTNLSVTTSAKLKNDVSLNFETTNGNNVTFKQQSDDNFVLYTTDTTGSPRAVYAIYANTNTSNLQILVPTDFQSNVYVGRVSANGSLGTNGQVLTSNGTTVYWQTVAAATGTNVNATFAWTNTHSFAANVSFGNSISLNSGNSTASGGMLFFSGLGDTNWKMGRNTNGTTKWFYTNNTIDIIAAGSPLEGVVIGQMAGNSFFETGYAGTFLAGNVTIGNTSSKSTINSTTFSGTANNASFLGSNSASDLRTYTDNRAANAYSNGVSYTDTKIGTANTAMAANAATAYSNAVSYTDGKIATANTAMTANAATAYTNAVSYTDTKIGTANTAMVANAAAAYTNATIFAANASNANNGTLAEARLPFRMDQNVRTVDNVEFVNVTITGNITVSGTQTVIGGNSLSITDNMIYMNQGTYGTISNISGNGSVVTFTANNNYAAGWDVFVSGVDPTSYNGTYLNILAANATHFQVSNTNTATYVSGGNVRGKSEQNPDLGFAFGYNDGTYHHGGFFRDASDGIFKVFDNYAPEPDTSVYIDTSNNTFRIANFQADTIYLGNTSVYGSINGTSFSGTANNALNLGGSSLATIQGQITGNAATAYTNSVSYVDTKISTANTAMVANAAAAYSNAVSYTDTKIGTANTAMAANAATAYSNAVSYTDTKIGTANTAMAANAATAYSNAVSYTDTKIGTANTAMAANAATAYSNAVSYTDTKIGTANTAMVANAAAAYTNAIAIAANASNITSGTVAFARLPSLYLGTTAIQSTSAAQAVSGITTLAAGNTTITGFANVTGNLTATNPIFNNIKHGYSTTATAAGTTVLTSSSNYQQFFTGTTTQIVSLPAPQTMTLGQGFLIVNNSTGNLEVRAANAAVVATVLPGTAVLCVSIDLTAGNGAAGWSPEFVGFSSITGTGSVVLSASPTFSGTVTLASSGLSSNGSLGTAGQTLHSNGSATYWAADDGVTSLVAANGINGGTITSTGTISVLGGSTLTVNTAGVHVNSALSITSLTLAGAASGITTLAAGNTTISGFANVTGGISLSGGTSNFINWSTAGVDGPSINTRSPGTKLLLYPALSVSQTDYAMGISPATIWSTVPQNDDSFKFKWYGADIEVASISGTGNFNATGYANVGTTLTVGTNTATFGTAAYIVANGNVGFGTSTPGSKLVVNGTASFGNTSITDLVVSGNLTVSGTRTYVNTTTLDVGDNIITLNADLGASAPSENAGIEVMRGTSANVQFIWDETNDRWSTNAQPLAVSSLIPSANITLGSAGLSANGSLGTAGQVLHSNGTAAYWATDDQGVTSVATANGLTGGTITSTGTLGVASGSTLTVNTTGIHVNSALAITSLALAGSANGITTLAAGNTTITGFANVTSSLQVGGVSTFSGNVVLGSSGVSANGSFGTGGQLLTSNGTSVYWSSPTSGVNAVQATYTYTLSSNTTLIQGADDNAAILNYTAGVESVFINGVRQIAVADYNTTNATAITLTANAIAGEVVQVVTWVGQVNTTNVNAQFAWTNTHVFNSLLTVNNDLFISGGGDLVISSAGIGGANANSWFYNDASDLYISVNNAIRAYVASNGNFGVGNTTPTDKLRVEGNISYSGNLIARAVSANGSVGTSGQILTSNGSTTYWQTQQFRTAGQTVVSANTTLDSTYLGENILVVTADVTITLPASGFDSGTLAFISNVSGGRVNLSYAYAGDGPTILYPGDSVILCTDGNGASLYWRQYSYTNTLGLEPVVAVAALDVDCSKGTYFTKTIAGSSTFTFSNVPAAGNAYSFTLEVTHTSGTITWPASVKWPSDTAPTLTTGKTHLFMFTTNNGGTRWRGSALADYVN